jgi:hypothetical protein
MLNGRKSALTKPIIMIFAALLIATGGLLIVHPAMAQTAQAPVGVANSNFDFYPYQGSGASYPSARFDTTVNIQTTLSATGYFTGATEGCSADDLWTYQPLALR